MARLIKAEPIANGIAIYTAENAYLNDTALDVLKMVAEWVNEAPTVDAVEVVHGHWTSTTEPVEHFGEMDYFKCSVCGKLQWFDTNYCPNCGADMRERRTDGQ